MTWQQFLGSLFALGLIAAERLLNRYLPDKKAKDDDADPPSVAR